MRKFPLITAAIAASGLMAVPALAQDTPPADSTEAAPESAPPPPTIDSDGDGTMDAWDQRGDGKADSWDTDGDGAPDTFDQDGDGAPDPK